MTKTIDERFTEFHKANPDVLGELERRAMYLIRAGAKRVGLKQLFEVLRYNHTIATNGDNLKLNNSYTSRYARLIIERRPDLSEYIETRKTKTQ